MKATYDPQYDMGYLRLQDREETADRTISVDGPGNTGPLFNLDVGKDGELLGIEFFAASKTMPREFLQNAERPTGKTE